MDSLPHLAAEVSVCRRCPRLVAWREHVAAERRAAFRDQEYWGRPVPGFGDEQASILVLGLAPAAHGGNRTGRVFTGDRSGDWLFRAMHRAGLANQATSVSRDDGLELSGAYITAVVKCAPPANKPMPDERQRCHPFLQRELSLLPGLRVVVCLGAFAYDAACAEFGVRPRPKFGHGLEVDAPNGLRLICSFHPSQQNTFTGRLTEAMLDAVFARAVAAAGGMGAKAVLGVPESRQSGWHGRESGTGGTGIAPKAGASAAEGASHQSAGEAIGGQRVVDEVGQ